MKRFHSIPFAAVFSLLMFGGAIDAAVAEPVYLTCDTDLGGGMHSRLLITLNYDASTLEMQLLPNLQPVTDRSRQSVLPMRVSPLEIT